MRKKMVSLMVFVLCCAPALARVEVISTVVDPVSPQHGLVVTVRIQNSGPFLAEVDGIRLQIKGSQRWVTVKSWDKPVSLQPGQRLIVEVAPAPDSPLAAALQHPGYELQAAVSNHSSGPGWDSADR